MSVGKSGHKSYYTTGIITGLNQTVEYLDENNNHYATLHGMVRGNFKSKKGDSGGVVFIPRTDSNGGPIPIGIMSGTNNADNPPYVSFFTSINDLPTALQTGRY